MPVKLDEGGPYAAGELHGLCLGSKSSSVKRITEWSKVKAGDLATVKVID